MKNALREFKPTLLNSKEVLNFYAEYINGKYIAFNPKLKRLKAIAISLVISILKKIISSLNFKIKALFVRVWGLKTMRVKKFLHSPFPPFYTLKLN
ncbi:hypothetical protein [Helicobacter pylori]|uniref:VirB4 family type IV secretion/conjugal transfer ATPase n=1 Tax=Helicobacter pylori TaxID=210 RepID=UPI00358DCA8C